MYNTIIEKKLNNINLAKKNKKNLFENESHLNSFQIELILRKFISIEDKNFIDFDSFKNLIEKIELFKFNNNIFQINTFLFKFSEIAKENIENKVLSIKKIIEILILLFKDISIDQKIIDIQKINNFINKNEVIEFFDIFEKILVKEKINRENCLNSIKNIERKNKQIINYNDDYSNKDNKKKNEICFERLYNHSKRQIENLSLKKNMKKLIEEEKTLSECTFNPKIIKISKNNRNINTKEISGYENSIQRLKYARKKLNDNKEKIELKIKDLQKKKNLKNNSLEKKSNEKKILFYIEIEISKKNKGIIAIYDNEDPKFITEKYSKIFKFSGKIKDNLEKKIKESINDYYQCNILHKFYS